jgi:hypothetical protein
MVIRKLPWFLALHPGNGDFQGFFQQGGRKYDFRVANNSLLSVQSSGVIG